MKPTVRISVPSLARVRAVTISACLGAILVMAVPALGQSVPAVDRIVGQVVPSWAPGAAIAVLSRSGLVHRKGYGLANLNSRTPTTPSTKFELASVSKQFTALAIMQLADRGVLSISDDARRFLPELPRAVTIESMLHHTSGLAENSTRTFPDPNRVTNEDMLGYISGQPFYFRPGSRYEYTNSNYVLLAVIVERASGRPFREYMRDEVFRPAGMLSTEVQDAWHPVAGLRGYDGRASIYRVGSITGDANVVTTLDDMIKWADVVRNKRLASETMWQRAHTSGRLANGRPVGYGYGWFISKVHGRRLVWHYGEWNGMSTYIGTFPAEQLTVIALRNQAFGLPRSMIRAIEKVFL